MWTLDNEEVGLGLTASPVKNKVSQRSGVQVVGPTPVAHTPEMDVGVGANRCNASLVLRLGQTTSRRPSRGTPGSQALTLVTWSAQRKGWDVPNGLSLSS